MVRVKAPYGSITAEQLDMLGHIADDVLAWLGPHHHPPERAVPLRRARAGARGAAHAGLGRAHHPRGVRRHGPQRHGLPPRRRLPVRGLRHQPLGRGRVPPLPAQPVRPAAAPQVQDQLLGLRHRLRPGHVQRRRRDRHHPHPRRRHHRAGLPGLRRRRARRQPPPRAGPRGLHRQGGRCCRPSRPMLRVFEQTGNRDNKLRARLKWVGRRARLRRGAADGCSTTRKFLLASSTLARRHPRRSSRSSATPRPAWPPARPRPPWARARR